MTQDPGAGAPMSERMQSLLSRAVEDQLSEQRQLAAALADVRAQLSRLGGQLEGIGGGASPTGAQLEQAFGAISGELREAVRLLGERLDGVGRLVQQRGHDLAEQRAVLGELRAAVDKHSEAIGGVAGGLGAMASLGERIDALQTTLGGLGDRLRGLEELTAAVGALQQRAEATDASVRELRQAFTGVAARAAQLPGREDLEAVSGRVAESVDGLGGRLSRLETSVPSLLERLDALAAAQGALQQSLDGVGERLDRPAQSAFPASDLAAVLNELQAVRDELAAATEPAESSGPELTALADQIGALHEGVLGDDGVIVRLEALETVDQTAPAPLDVDAVESAVARAVAASEQRLTEHVDEAVLLLAEALLRRRTSSRASAAGGPFAARPSSVAGVIDEDDEDEDSDEDIPGVGSWDRPERADAAEAAEEPQEPQEQPEVAGPVDQADDDAQKRKPWWRPGG